MLAIKVMNFSNNKFKKEEGSFTVEASLIFPVVLFILVLLLFFTMYMYQKTFLNQHAYAASERAAYSWDNSHKQAMTGEFVAGEHDNLYWRLTDDRMLGALFGWAGADNQVSVAIPAGEGGSLSEQKLAQAVQQMPSAMKGTIEYQNSLIQRKITTKLEQVISLPLPSFLFDSGNRVLTQGSSAVVEPVEFIRTVDLVRYYAAKFKGKGGAATSTAAEAGQVVQHFGKSKK
ncbi:TadE/TadG family type IV pilus assembly protein [Paenibacillus sp. ClWae2A]|uniref:TadE/TadG family type IV pilus assembly protein n=1 Tax=Paenibacillus sp. ClWae2A TaxID=3057177 RepID=UPI0028F52832|nr:TadE/TadG family type IV pilus assembly protein [Paenibacillus sp. ClWae2A]MDT9721223.1 TadE/TadG family type IV pilus assembly protein [Paenibacillus sp. ClWae2A]